MRRPMCIAAGAFALGIAICYLLAEKGSEHTAAVCTVITSITAAIVFIYIFAAQYKPKTRSHDADSEFKRVSPFWLFLIVFLLGMISMYAEYTSFDKYEELAYEEMAGNEFRESKAVISGIVLQSEEKEADEKYSFVIKTEEGSRVLVNLYKDKDEEIEDAEGNSIQDCHVITGRYASVKGKAELPQGRGNPGTFDYALYLRTKGIRSVINIGTADMEISCRPYTSCGKIINAIDSFKGRFDKRITNEIGEEKAGFLLGMLFGEKASLDEEVYEQFQRNGTAHILSVSGLHVGLVYMCISKILRRKHGRFASIVVLAVLLIYAALSLFSPSVVRAVMMIALNILSGILHRRYDLLSSACLCAFTALVFNPYILFNTGFQLSYIAIISIAVISNKIKKFYSGMMLPIVSVQAGMIPITAYLFNYVSLGAFIANIPVVFLAGLIIPIGMLMMVLLMVMFPFQGQMFEIVCGTASVVCDMMVYMNELTYMDGKLTFDVVSPSIFLLVIYYSTLFIGLSETMAIWIRRRAYKFIVLLVIAAVLTGGMMQLLTNDGFEDADMVFADVGQGDCLHIKTDEGKSFLVDGGGSSDYDVGKQTLKPYLLKNGVRKVAAAFVSHLHTDHYDGIVSLCREGMIERLCIYEGNRVLENKILEETGLSPKQLVYLEKGDIVTLGKDVKIEILSPDMPDMPHMSSADTAYTQNADEDLHTDDENENSLIMKIDYKGFTVLMNGDIDSGAEAKLISECGSKLKCDILKAAHHGSKYSSSKEFIEAVNPKIAVIQVGKNNYGHPTPEVLSRLAEQNIPVLRNDEHGAVGFEIKDGTWTYVTMKKIK